MEGYTSFSLSLTRILRTCDPPGTGKGSGRPEATCLQPRGGRDGGFLTRQLYSWGAAAPEPPARSPRPSPANLAMLPAGSTGGFFSREHAAPPLPPPAPSGFSAGKDPGGGRCAELHKPGCPFGCRQGCGQVRWGPCPPTLRLPRLSSAARAVPEGVVPAAAAPPAPSRAAPHPPPPV